MATANQVRNIIIGAATVFLSKKDSTDPTWAGGPSAPAGVASTSVVNPVTGDLPVTADWRNVGFTKEGVELSYEPDYADVEMDQLLDAAVVFKQGMKVSLKTTLGEASLENLLVAWGQQSNTYSASAVASDVTRLGSSSPVAVGDTFATISSGSLGDSPVERALIAVGPGPRSLTGVKRERVYHARRVLSVDSSSQALRRNEATVFPVSFRLLPDPSAPVGAEYGLIRDRNIV